MFYRVWFGAAAYNVYATNFSIIGSFASNSYVAGATGADNVERNWMLLWDGKEFLVEVVKKYRTSSDLTSTLCLGSSSFPALFARGKGRLGMQVENYSVE